MTLGQKLSAYRKLAGMTQGQLGERLNLSAQAISKWENDMAEPDLATLRTLAELYQISIDELLSAEAPSPNFGEAAEQPTFEPEPIGSAEQTAPAAPPIGFCKECGVTVTEENLGAKEPVVLCKKCLAAKQEADRRAAEQAKRAAEQAKREKEMAIKHAEAERAQNRHRLVKRLVWSLVVATIVAGAFLAITLAAANSDGGMDKNMVIFAVVMIYPIFAFISCLFFDTVVSDVFIGLVSKSIHWPGLIFSFDIDGFIWLITMKILFFILGLLFGILMFFIGLACGFVVAIFVFPFTMVKASRAIKSGNASNLDDLLP